MSSRESASINSKQSAPRKNSSKALSLHDSSSQPKKPLANNLKISDNILDLSLLTQSTHVSGIGKNIQEIARDNSFFCKIVLRPIEQKPLGFDSFCTPKKGSFLEDLNSNSSQKKNFNYYGRYRFQSAASNKIQLRLNTDTQLQENVQPSEKPKSAVFDMTISGLSTIRSLHEGQQQSHRSCKSSVFTNYSERIKTESSGNPHNKAGFSYTLGLKSQQSETDKSSFNFQLINQLTLPKNYSNTITFNKRKREPSKEEHHHSQHNTQQQQQQQQLGKQVYDAQELKRHRTYHHSSKFKRIPTIQHNFEWENL